jgi:hypothetical protein
MAESKRVATPDLVVFLLMAGMGYGVWLVALTLWKLCWKLVAFAWS